MRAVFIASALSLAACSGVNTGQSLKHPSPPEATIGLGFDSLSGMTRGACIVKKSTETRPGTKRLSERVFHARSKEELLHEMGFAGGVSFGLSSFGINLGFDTLDRDAQTASTSFAVVRIHLEAQTQILDGLELEKHAAETLRREGPDAFYEKCGDGFISAIEHGGTFLGIIALQGVSREEERRIGGSGGVSFLGIGVNGGAHTTNRSFYERHQARYYIVQEGGDPGGATTLQRLQSVDALLARAERFKYAVVYGNQTVATDLIIKPYQVTSNRPRRADLWNLTQQRRFLTELAVDYGELQRAEAELSDKLASATCPRKADKRRIAGLHAEYQQLVQRTHRRAEDCMNNPRRECTGRGLAGVDLERHRKTMALCPQPRQILSSPYGGTPSAPSDRAQARARRRR